MVSLRLSGMMWMTTETHDFNFICPISRLQCVGNSCACSVCNTRRDRDNDVLETEYACGLANNNYVGGHFHLPRTFYERVKYD